MSPSYLFQPLTRTAPRYVVAVCAVGAAFAFRSVLDPWLGDNVPYLHFFPAVLVAGWYGGFGPGMLATALSALIAMYAYLPPAGFAVGSAGDLLSLSFFTAIGFAISGLYHQLRRTDLAHRDAADLAGARAERLSAIINTTVDGIIVIDERGGIESFNRGAERLFGYAETEVVGRNVNMLMPSPDYDRHDEYLARYLRTGERRIIGTGRQVQGRRRDGSVFPLHLSVGEMVVDGQRKFTGMLHDLSARVGLEDQLRRSEARWRAVIDSAVDGIILIDAHGRIETFNPAAERLFGYTEPEVQGQNVSILMPAPYQDEHDNYLMRYLATGSAKIIGTGREVFGRRKDGSTFPLHLSVGEIDIAGERKFTGILHDLSARVTIEAQLREQAAMARLGEMSAVIAHEVKNPLAGIRGAIQVIGGRMAPGSQDAAIAAEIIKRIDSLDLMMKDLLLFARPARPRWAMVEMAPLLNQTAGMLRRDPEMNGVTVDIRGEAPPIPADPDMLTIVFQNLFVNSAQAMEREGRIVADVTVEAPYCRVAVSDNGPGIAADVIDKVFTPFFTTKARGSGLGLPTAKRIIDAHHGQISIQSPATGGTTVVIRLPLEQP